MNVSNLSDQEHIQAYEHGIRPLSWTKLLATKNLLTFDKLLDTIHEFIKGEISVKNKSKQHDNIFTEGKGRKPYHLHDTSRQPVKERLSYLYHRDLQKYHLHNTSGRNDIFIPL